MNTQDYIREIDQMSKNDKGNNEKLEKFKCDISKGEGVCDVCNSKNNKILYSGFKSAMFYSYCVCPKCIWEMRTNKIGTR